LETAPPGTSPRRRAEALTSAQPVVPRLAAVLMTLSQPSVSTGRDTAETSAAQATPTATTARIAASSARRRSIMAAANSVSSQGAPGPLMPPEAASANATATPQSTSRLRAAPVICEPSSPAATRAANPR
jgi:hypothetical protein